MRQTYFTIQPLGSSDFVCPFDSARHTISNAIRAKHPDARVASGAPPRPLPKLGLSRAGRTFLLRLRVGCAKTAQRVAHLSGTGSPVCLSCNDDTDETLSHIVLECAGYIHARDALTAAYRRLGLPSDNADVLLFPRGHPSIIKRAFTALLDFFETTTLYTRL